MSSMLRSNLVWARALSSHAGERSSFDIEAIRASRPFPPWLVGEMKSNQAGETGAVHIYSGSLWALGLRKCVRAQWSKRVGQGSAELGYLNSAYEDDLLASNR
jgi:demethoxyubiquinone hydroxylase (CLK1/Coq7/Cat5 family)